jgi:hypothetical protein
VGSANEVGRSVEGAEMCTTKGKNEREREEKCPKGGHVTLCPECARSHYEVQSIVLVHRCVCALMRSCA